MSATRSGFCFGPDKPRLHKLCKGTFNPGAGNVELTGPAKCACDCHVEGTELRREVHGAAAARP